MSFVGDGNITAAEARGIVAGIDWDNFVNYEIELCNKRIRDTAEHGYREIHLAIWTKEQYVWDKIIQHFQNNGFIVTREWCGIVIKW